MKNRWSGLELLWSQNRPMHIYMAPTTVVLHEKVLYQTTMPQVSQSLWIIQVLINSSRRARGEPWPAAIFHTNKRGSGSRCGWALSNLSIPSASTINILTNNVVDDFNDTNHGSFADRWFLSKQSYEEAENFPKAPSQDQPHPLSSVIITLSTLAEIDESLHPLLVAALVTWVRT